MDVVDWANDANPITRTPMAMIAMIVMISKFRLFGRNSLFPGVDGLKDNLVFTSSVTEKKTSLMLLLNFQDGSLIYTQSRLNGSRKKTGPEAFL